MQRIKREITIHASAEKVFDLIDDVTGFTRLSKHIKDIKEIGPKTYLWNVEFLGISYSWEAIVYQCERPRVFAWKSTKGLHNGGSYTLSEEDGKTRLTLMMEYQIPSRMIEMLARPIFKELAQSVGDEVLGNVRRELERG